MYFGDSPKVDTYFIIATAVCTLADTLPKQRSDPIFGILICDLQSLHFMSTWVWAWWSSFFTCFLQCMPFRIASSSHYYGLPSDVRWIRTKREGYEGCYTVWCFLREEIFARTFLVYDSSRLLEYFERFLRCAVLSQSSDENNSTFTSTLVRFVQLIPFLCCRDRVRNWTAFFVTCLDPGMHLLL